MRTFTTDTLFPSMG